MIMMTLMKMKFMIVKKVKTCNVSTVVMFFVIIWSPIFVKNIHFWFLTFTLNLLRAASLIGRGRICFASGANFKNEQMRVFEEEKTLRINRWELFEEGPDGTKHERGSAISTFEATLKELKGEEGGCLKGRQPKLNSHCWNDMKLAAGKKPDLGKKDICQILKLDVLWFRT